MARTKWELGDAIRCANELADLADEHWSGLAPRCAPDAVSRLRSEVAALVAAQVEATNKRIDKRAATLRQNEALARGQKVVSLVRNLIRSSFRSNKALRRRFGSGTRPKSSRSTRAALKLLLSAMQEESDKARRAGLLPEDVAVVRDTLSMVLEAERARAATRASASAATAERDRAQRRVERAVSELHAVARLAFRLAPETCAQFDRAMPTSRGARDRARRKAARLAAQALPAA